ncbi:MAG: hypothetical protein SF339_07035 [Blastocatellia bacterium]|nr:hypothetical protein [Blastocatellia bacterium]
MAKVKINFSHTTAADRRNLIKELRPRLDIHETLRALIETMHVYESQFGMSTVEFYARYLAGQMGDSRDVMRWAGAFDDYQSLLREHFQHAAA